MKLELSAEEHGLLIQTLEQRHLELQKAISHTDHREFKEVLRKNEKLIESMLNRFGPAPFEGLLNVVARLERK